MRPLDRGRTPQARTIPVPLRLRDNLHWCSCTGRAVFLDIEGGRYFCLPAAANGAFLRLAEGKPEPGDGDRLKLLIERGVLVEDCSAASPLSAPLIEPVTCDYVSEPHAPAGLLHILRALVLEFRVTLSLRAYPLQRIIEAAAQRRGWRVRRSDDLRSSIGAIVAAADAAAMLTRSHNRCLVRAFAVHAACKSIGADAKLVFGVIARPFAAHCWVQLGGAVVVGSFEQARLYTPILVIE